MRRVLLSAALLLAFLAPAVAPVGVARAASPVRQATEVVLEIDAARIPLGGHPRATVRLTSGGRAVSGRVVAIRINGTISQQVTTGANGRASTTITRNLPTGTYRLTATFAGDSGYIRSDSRTVRLIVAPAELVITTVPPIAGLSLISVDDGAPLTTDSSGRVHVHVAEVGRISLRLALPTDEPTRRIEFVRWGDGVAGPDRDVRVPDTTGLSVGLQVSYPVRFEFAGSQQTPIDPRHVPAVTVTDNAGTAASLTGAGENWLPANRVRRDVDGLTSTAIRYRVSEVPIGGANVVNRGQQQFEVDGPSTVHVDLLVFNLTILGRDALFGTQTGSEVRITAPNGDQQTVALDDHGSAILPLPRGEYQVELGGGLGYSVPALVSLSRDQATDAKLLSLFDIVLIGGIFVMAGVGLILIGRPSLLLRRRRSVNESAD